MSTSTKIDNSTTNPISSIGLDEIILIDFDPLQSETNFKKLEKLFPDNPDVLLKLGITLSRMKRFEEACEKFEQADFLRPCDPTLLAFWGAALAKIGRFRESFAVLKQAAKLSGSNR